MALKQIAVHRNIMDSLLTFQSLHIPVRYLLTCIALQRICMSQSKLHVSNKNDIMSVHEGEIDWNLNALNQEHPRLLQHLKEYYLSYSTDLHRRISYYKLSEKSIYVRLSTYIYILRNIIAITRCLELVCYG